MGTEGKTTGKSVTASGTDSRRHQFVLWTFRSIACVSTSCAHLTHKVLVCITVLDPRRLLSYTSYATCVLSDRAPVPRCCPAARGPKKVQEPMRRQSALTCFLTCSDGRIGQARGVGITSIQTRSRGLSCSCWSVSVWVVTELIHAQRGKVSAFVMNVLGHIWVGAVWGRTGGQRITVFRHI